MGCPCSKERGGGMETQMVDNEVLLRSIEV